MRVKLIAVGTRMPSWIAHGIAEYQVRLPRAWRFEVVEIPVASRSAGVDVDKLKQAEGQKMLRAAGEGTHIVAFDEAGAAHTTVQWATAVQQWQRDGRDVALLIGGPDGLSPECLRRAAQRWSLSPLTLPHGLARVMVVEQLYRAVSILEGHPYHRA
jgi:23S rRNA (pseudouridine1915-N3)-methyltransferase